MASIPVADTVGSKFSVVLPPKDKVKKEVETPLATVAVKTSTAEETWW